MEKINDLIKIFWNELNIHFKTYGWCQLKSIFSNFGPFRPIISLKMNLCKIL